MLLLTLNPKALSAHVIHFLHDIFSSVLSPLGASISGWLRLIALTIAGRGVASVFNNSALVEYKVNPENHCIPKIRELHHYRG